MELFVFCHARESGSPAGTGQNASGGRKGFKVSSRSVDSQISSNEFLLGQNTAPQQSNPGAQDPPFYLSATTPARHVSQVAPRAAPAPVLRLMGKGAVGPLPPQQPKGKGKRRTRALAWKRRESSSEISHCSPKRLSVAWSLTVSGSKVRWAEATIELLRPCPPSKAPAARTLTARAPAASPALLSSGKPARATSFPRRLG